MTQTPAPRAPTQPATLSALEWKQFERIGAALIMLGVISTLFGLSWDVQWHTVVGPDTFWTIPHLFVYAGAAISGFASLTFVLLCTQVSRLERQPDWIPVLGGRFYAPLGFILAGFGALGFFLFGVFDQWWHTLFGFDVLISSGPHVGLLFSDILSMIGCALIFVRGKQTISAGVIVAMGLMMCLNLPVLIAIFVDFVPVLPALEIVILGLQALLLPMAFAFVIAATRNVWAAFWMGLVMIAFREISLLTYPGITLAYADSLGWAIRDGWLNRPEVSVLIPRLVPVAGLAASLILMLAQQRSWSITSAVLLAGSIAGPILYLDSSLLPLEGLTWLALIPLALVGAFGMWTGKHLGFTARFGNTALAQDELKHLEPAPSATPPSAVSA
jgi:hypothetical protein